MQARKKMELLRTEMNRENIDAYIIPHGDVHQNEYLPDCNQRLGWFTDFTGSAGLAIAGLKKAAIFVDGRYTIQLREQADMDLFQPCHLSFPDIDAWLRENLEPGNVVGFDPWLMSVREIRFYEEMAGKAGFVLKAISGNLLDRIHPELPPLPREKMQVHALDYAGVPIGQKLQDICLRMEKSGADATIVVQVDMICWLLNIRGDDLSLLPAPLVFAIVHRDRYVDLFVDPDKITPEVRSHLNEMVRFFPYEGLGARLEKLGNEGISVLVDPGRTPWQAMSLVLANGGKIIEGEDVCLLPRACKNSVEVEGARQAHIKDGVAVVNFLAWLEEAILLHPVTEMDVVEKLYEFRKAQGVHSNSFDTITGSGPNGAIVHYKATPETNRQLKRDELFLLDSGGQYLEGTTDITRTMTFSTADPSIKDRFTRVLKGHIMLARVRFPKGTSGHQLDALARYHLWQEGLDYAHGTGHGVGSYLSVHEGPQRIAPVPNNIALQPGMILSNEPGYYKSGEYGIRIENLVVVRESLPSAGYENEMLYFETLTRVPIDRRLIDVSLLDEVERGWLNNYHACVRESLYHLVDSHAKSWLEKMTQPV